MTRFVDYSLVAAALAGLAVGLVLSFWVSAPAAQIAWTVATLPVLIALVVQIAASLRRGDVGLDIVAALSMSSALVLGEALAGNVVALMYAGGQLLEGYAQGRARHEMSALLGRVARTAMRVDGAKLEEVPINLIMPGDRLFIRNGEVLPVDGMVAGSAALLDLAALTGEALPQRFVPGAEAPSGATCTGSPFELVARRPAAESTYAGIVRLVEAAQRSKAPMMRVADRYAIGFLALTVAIAAAAWIGGHDPLRALAVLVVATPCPLILAVPVAIMSGLSRTARAGVLIKNGGILETLARVRTVVIDKTGTLTQGRASISRIRPVDGFSEDEVLRLAASLDQASGHVVAAALVEGALARNLVLSTPGKVEETAGEGIVGEVDRRPVVVGGVGFVTRHLAGPLSPGLQAGFDGEAGGVAVAVDGRPAGLIVLEDRVRGDAGATLASLRRAGVNRIVLASGDRSEIARAVGDRLGIELALGELDPGGKVEVVRAEAARATVMMVGDGVNDAPALAAADVGVAMGARGTAASSEAAGVVMLVDELEPLARAMAVARRTLRIALQSVFVGLGLSTAAMVAAAFGYLPPVQGALLQEAIDVAVILNALRALR